MAQYDKLEKLLKIYGSQRKLAEALGVNQSQISRWISGKTAPRQQVKDIISKRFYYQTKQKLKKYVSEVPKHKKITGKKSDKRKYSRYEFSLRRVSLIDTTKIPSLFNKLKKLYRSVKEYDQQYKTQRLGIAIASNSREKYEKEYYSKKANRSYKKSVEELQYITTIIYARNKESTNLMFDELEEKLRRYLMGTLESEDIHDVETLKEAKTFYVFFEDESIEY
jgi:transcriptional regulator with XRE-family HTH domain